MDKKRKNEDEEKIYNETISSFNSQIDVLQNWHKENNDNERNELLEVSVFLNMLKNLHSYFKNATYVQKRKISKILFSNIIIHNEKKLTIRVNSNFKPLFSGHLEMTGIELSGVG